MIPQSIRLIRNIPEKRTITNVLTYKDVCSTDGFAEKQRGNVSYKMTTSITFGYQQNAKQNHFCNNNDDQFWRVKKNWE